VIDISVVKIRDTITPDMIYVENDYVFLQVGRLRHVDYVLVDGIRVSHLITRQMIRLTLDEINTAMDTIDVIYSTYFGSGRATAEFNFSFEQPLVRGETALLQKIVRKLLIEPRTNVFRPAEGGGAVKAAAEGFPDSKMVRVGLMSAVDVVESQILQEQMRTSGLLKEERLISMSLADVVVDVDTVRAGIFVRTAARETLLYLPS